MQIKMNQMNPFNQFNNCLVSSTYRANSGISLHTRRKMLEAQDEAKEMEAVKVTISGEAMELSRRVKEMEREQQLPDIKKTEEDKESVQLSDGDLYDELVNQIQIWGDQASNIRNKYNHEETAEMAAERAAALTQLQKLEELQKSETSKLEKDAQKAAEMASVQQEEINRKSSELIMMIESFEEQEEDGGAEVQDGEDDTEQEKTASNGSLMEGQIGAAAAERELGMLNTIGIMDQSSAERIAANDQSIRGLMDERKNIYRMNNDSGTSVREKIDAMSNYVSTLANRDAMEDYFQKRIAAEADEGTRKKLELLSDYFLDLDYKNEAESLTKDRAYALQERINARDLRIAHLGDRHLAMAERQKKELQSLFDEDDIMRTQGQGSIAGRAEEVAELLQDKLDERDHVDEDSISDEELHEKDAQKEQELEEEEQEDYPIGEEQEDRYREEINP